MTYKSLTGWKGGGLAGQPRQDLPPLGLAKHLTRLERRLFQLHSTAPHRTSPHLTMLYQLRISITFNKDHLHCNSFANRRDSGFLRTQCVYGIMKRCMLHCVSWPLLTLTNARNVTEWYWNWNHDCCKHLVLIYGCTGTQIAFRDIKNRKHFFSLFIVWSARLECSPDLYSSVLASKFQIALLPHLS